LREAIDRLGAGLGHLVRLQCYCEGQYDQHGSGMPVVPSSGLPNTFVSLAGSIGLSL
jgi:hypothetical protein